MTSQHKVLLALGVAVLAGGCALTAMGCSLGGSITKVSAPSPDQTRAYSRALVEIAETAWQQEAEACVNVASMTNDTTLLNSCKTSLLYASDGFELANTALDSWTAVDQREYACAAGKIIQGITSANALLTKKGVAQPLIINDLNVIANFLDLTCSLDSGTAPSQDAGISVG